MQKVLEVVRTEQLLNSMGEEVRVWAQEGKSKTCTGAGELVDNYELARKTGKVDMKQEEWGEEATKWIASSVFCMWTSWTYSV